MREDWPRKLKVVPIGSREWLDMRLHQFSPPDDWLCDAAEPVRQFLREIGQRGGLHRSRNYARRNFRKGVRFWQRYGSNPNKVAAAPVKASPEQRRYLRTYASRGGQARARKCSREQLRAWAAKGGRARAAKRRQASSPAQAVAGKQD